MQKNREDADESKGISGTGRRGWVINPDEPTAEWLDAFAEARWDAPINNQYGAYENKLEAIITQKYVNFNIMFAREAWNDIRRTGYPKINFPTFSDATVPNVPVRLRYPVGERDYNKNFSEVADQDNYTTKMFWAK
jgi:hypothetical protein